MIRGGSSSARFSRLMLLMGCAFVLAMIAVYAIRNVGPAMPLKQFLERMTVLGEFKNMALYHIETNGDDQIVESADTPDAWRLASAYQRLGKSYDNARRQFGAGNCVILIADPDQFTTVACPVGKHHYAAAMGADHPDSLMRRLMAVAAMIVGFEYRR